MTRADVIKKLLEVQNNKFFANQDIMTITGFMKTTTEVLHHLMSCKRQIENAA
jgi:hypothetical protein